MRGDVLLYRHDASLVSTAIAFFTGGDFSHTGVRLDETSSIEAHAEDGVQVRHINFPTTVGHFPNREIVVVPIRDFGAKEDDIEAGIDFLQSEVGSKYSYLDCLDDLPLLKRLGLVLAVRGRFDCSHLVAEYIKHTNCLLTKILYPDDATTAAVSPNDIARAAGVK